MEMCEDDLMREERDPFEGVRPISRRAADQFMLAIAMFHQLRATELLDDAPGTALRYQMIQFHAASLARGVGQWLSNPKKIRDRFLERLKK